MGVNKIRTKIERNKKNRVKLMKYIVDRKTSGNKEHGKITYKKSNTSTFKNIYKNKNIKNINTWENIFNTG